MEIGVHAQPVREKELYVWVGAAEQPQPTQTTTSSDYLCTHSEIARQLAHWME
jgi:hypothetical protein